MLLQLPIELLLEVVSYLDLEAVIGLLQAFPRLLAYVRLYRDFEHFRLVETRCPARKTKGLIMKHHSIVELFPSLTPQSWAELEKPADEYGHIKIVELRLTSGPKYSGANLWDGYLTPEELQLRLDRICALCLFNKTTFVRLVGSFGQDFRHHSLAKACDRSGAKFETGLLPQLHFPAQLSSNATRLPRLARFRHLTELRIAGQTTVQIASLPCALLVLVELGTPALGQRARFAIESAPRLRQLMIHYHGEKVPLVDIGQDVFFDRGPDYDVDLETCDSCQIQSDGSRFELKRLGGTSKTGPPTMSYDDGIGYVHGINLQKGRVCCVCFDGVPDWVLASFDFRKSRTVSLCWMRWKNAGATVLFTRPEEPLCLRKVLVLKITTDIHEFKVPHMDAPYIDEIFIITYAHGLSLNGIINVNLDQEFESVSCLSIICPDFKHSEDKPLVLTRQDLCHLKGKLYQLHLQGHIIIESQHEIHNDPGTNELMSESFRHFLNVSIDMTSTILLALKTGQDTVSFKTFYQPRPVPISSFHMFCYYLRCNSQLLLSHLDRPTHEWKLKLDVWLPAVAESRVKLESRSVESGNQVVLENDLATLCESIWLNGNKLCHSTSLSVSETSSGWPLVPYSYRMVVDTQKKYRLDGKNPFHHRWMIVNDSY